MDSLKEKLSNELNKPITDNFVESLKQFIRKNNDQERFTNYCKILGFHNDSFIKDVYDLLLLHLEDPEIPKPKIHSKPPKLKNNTLAFEGFDQEEEILVQPKKQKILAFDDIEDVAVKPKKTFKFKKIKKEDALKLKEEPSIPTKQLTPTPLPNKSKLNSVDSGAKIEKPSQPTLSLAELAQQETVEKELDYELPADFDVSEDLENDREWYMGDEYDNIEVEDVPTSRPRFKPKPRVKSHESGGRFNEYGEYVDFDHETDTNDLSNMPISSHFFVPPFLEESKEFLSLQLNEGQQALNKGIAASFSPVKNPNSHLAIMARKGSSVVHERRSKKERAKLAKEKSGLEGSNMGNVLGVNSEDSNATDKSEQTAESSLSATEIDIQRKSLPVYTVRSDLIQVISDNQVVVIIGETGSGKTTQLAQYLYEEGFGKNILKNGIRQQIGCTQPRRVAAMSVAKRVSEEVGCKLGEEVGYSIRFEDKTTKDKTVIKYLTEGILLREMLMDPNLDNYSCIIMDEAHERTLNADILFGLLRMLVMKRKDLKLIVTSATMNADLFTRFFGNAPQFEIPGRTFPVEVFYNRSVNDYVDAAVKQVLTIHLETLNEKQESDGDILVFMTGQEDIETTCDMIHEKLAELEGIAPLDVFPIYSTLPADLQKKIFNKSSKYKRKVVVATNIAETSLTVDGVRYVIDCGLNKLKVYNPKLGMDALQMIPISQANANQRSGRAGRTGPGKAFRLYSEKELEEDMNKMPIPEIQRTNLNNIMLLLKSLKVKDISKFPFMDAPPDDILACSLYDLWSIGALDNFGDLTPLGLQMISFPMEPSLSKLIILSSTPEFKCSLEILIIVSMLSVPNIFHRPKERANEADMAREKFSISESDHLTLLNVYQQWETQLRKPGMSPGKLSLWSTRNFLNNRSLLRAREIKNQLILIMKQMKLPILKSIDDEAIKRCLCACFFNQAARLSKLNLTNANQMEYLNLRYGFMKMYLHPTSSLNNSTNVPPTFVIYHELILTTKEYMSCVTAVDPLWLLEYGYIFYGVSKYDQTKYLNFQLPFDIIDKSSLQQMLERDRAKFQAKDTQPIQARAQQAIKASKFKRRGI